MDRKQYENFSFNMSLAEHDDLELTARDTFRQTAAQEVSEAFLAAPLEDPMVPEYFDAAVGYATTLVYKTGEPIFHRDDIKRALDYDRDHRLPTETSWFPASTDQRKLTSALIHKVSELGIRDTEPAFGPHNLGRPCEANATPGTQYNKFGLLIY